MKYLILIFLAATGCTSNKGTTTGNPVTATEDSSVSGAAAQAVGGALSATSASGTVSFAKPSREESLTAGTCPDYSTTDSTCTVNAGTHTMWLDYNSCTFASSAAVWHGTQAIIGSSGTPVCGTFPSVPASGSITRQFVSAPGSTTPHSMIITSRFSTIGGIDDHTADLANFDNQTLPTIVNGGYGDRVQFGSLGQRTAVTLGHRIVVLGGYDHTVYGSLSISEAAGAHTRTISGAIDTYHNGLKVIGTSTFNNVTHSDTCCLPISGNISTLFRAGTNVSPTTGVGDAAVGKTETLTFTGCGTATYTSYDGTTQSVALSRCY